MSNRFENPLPGVPLVESPFFDDAIDALELDEPVKLIAEQLHSQGWAVIDFPDPEFDAVAERIKQSLTPHYDWDYWRRSGWQDNDGLRIQDAHKLNADVRRIDCRQPTYSRALVAAIRPAGLALPNIEFSGRDATALSF